MTSRFDILAETAPDVAAAWRCVGTGEFLSVRREVRRRGGEGSAASVVRQLAVIAVALTSVVETLPERAFSMPGGEGDWNVAQALGHTADARAGLTSAASMAASGRWPAAAPAVVPGIAGAADATREALLRRIATSQRVVERAGRQVAGHEMLPCPLEHPLVGRMRCGEWLLFAGVHDLMHLEQLETLEARLL